MVVPHRKLNGRQVKIVRIFFARTGYFWSKRGDLGQNIFVIWLISMGVWGHEPRRRNTDHARRQFDQTNQVRHGLEPACIDVIYEEAVFFTLQLFEDVVAGELLLF